MAEIKITVEEYKELLSKSEKLEMIRKFVESSKYSPVSEIKVILDIKEGEEE